jgi:hypothetical protein
MYFWPAVRGALTDGDDLAQAQEQEAKTVLDRLDKLAPEDGVITTQASGVRVVPMASAIADCGRPQKSARKIGLYPCTLREGPRGAATGDPPATLGPARGPSVRGCRSPRAPSANGRWHGARTGRAT